MNPRHLLACAALAGTLAVTASGCGDDVPAGSVARVGDVAIPREAFDTWYQSAAKGQAQQGGPAVPPDPPNFEKCIAGLRKQQPKDSEAKDADLKKQCRQADEQLRQQVMQFLIQSQWIIQQADEMGVEVSNQEVRQQFDEQKKQAFPKEADYKKFLKTSGTSEDEILFRVKLDTLQRKLTEEVQKDADEVTDEDVEEYFAENSENFSQPAGRDLNVVVTKTKAKAEQAKAELEDGASFKQVAKKHSTDQASKANDGKMPGVTQGQYENALDEAIFGAEKEEIVGPIESQLGWFVFEVTDETPASEQSLEDVEETIRAQLKQQREQEAMQDFISGFRRQFQRKTVCLEDFMVAECGNSPEAKTDTGPASGGPPGGPPPGALGPDGVPQPGAPEDQTGGSPQAPPPAGP